MAKSARARASEVLRVVAKAAEVPDMSQFAAELIAQMGGVRELARECAENYRSAHAGTVSKAKALESIMRVVVKASEENKRTNETGDLSDEQLFSELVMELRKRDLLLDEDDGVTSAAA